MVTAISGSLRCLQDFWHHVIQTGPAMLSLRLEIVPGVEASQVWETAIARLQDYLAGQGLPGITIQKTAEPPQRDPASGKFRQVWSEMGHTR
jgi:hypothetical protein